MRKKIVVGNWKMFTTTATARSLAEEIVSGVGSTPEVEVGVCPPSPYLAVVGEVLRGTSVGLGAQNVYPEKEGAFTGEVGLTMLQDLGCRWVILGHSERRHKLGETDAFIQRKVHAALGAGLKVILCIGETQEERQHGQTRTVVESQLTSDLAGLTAAQIGNLVLAYEPVWAIGTGIHATPEQAQETIHEIRNQIGKQFDAATAATLQIQYGGSMNPANAAELLHLPDVDGGLIGGASLKADQFLAIVRAAGSKRV